MTPEGWESRRVGELITNIGDGGTPRRDNPSYFGGDIPWVVIQDIKPLITVTKNSLTKEGLDACSAKLWPKNAVILSTGATIGEVGIAGVPLATKQGITGMVCKEYVIPKFLYYLLQQKKQYLQTLAQGSTIREVRPPILEKIDINLPPKSEQKKIAAILSSVDDAIQATQDVIDQTRRVKQGLMQQLLTRGIGHTRFKQTEIGEIPESWEVVSYGNILKKNMPPIDMKDNELYGPVIVRRRHNGIEVREQKLGINILVKNQFVAVPGTFLISKRQIIHGSSGIVPADIGDNAIISKEYIALSATKKLDIRYLKYFARTPIFHKSIVKTTYGVDDEKFVFKDEWWLKEKMPLPPIEEQKKICDILDSNKNFIDYEEKRLKIILAVKKGLMQDLLTGSVRVKLDKEATT